MWCEIFLLFYFIAYMIVESYRVLAIVEGIEVFDSSFSFFWKNMKIRVEKRNFFYRIDIYLYNFINIFLVFRILSFFRYVLLAYIFWEFWYLLYRVLLFFFFLVLFGEIFWFLWIIYLVNNRIFFYFMLIIYCYGYEFNYFFNFFIVVIFFYFVFYFNLFFIIIYY